MRRKPSVAGQFYPGDAKSLEKEVSSYIKETKKENVMGVISPHAGYIYSGRVAGSVFSSVNVPGEVIIIGPNHTGMGAAEAIMTSGTWELPGGEVEINSSLAESILKGSRHLRDDQLAHLREHSLEVQIPFIRHFRRDVRIVPIAMMSMDYEVCGEIGRAIANAVREYKSPVLIVASSDMTHYESDRSAREKDRKAIEKILAMDPSGLLDTVRRNRITMCGVIPATIMLITCKELGALSARLVDYDTSAATSGDYDHVVGYAGIIVS